MRVRLKILILSALCSTIVSRLTYAQTLSPASTNNADEDVATDAPKDENSTVPSAESLDPDAPLLSNEDSTHIPETSQTVDFQQRERFKRALPHIIKAEGLFENDMFEAAATEYKRASEILKGHPKYFQTQYNLGLCYERLFRYTEALEYYENYLKTAEPQIPNRVEVEKLIETLRGLLATLRISVNVKAAVWVDGLLIGHAPGELLVAGGRHRIELRAYGYETEQLEVRVPAQTARKLTFRMKAIGRFQGIDPIYFWVSSALAVTAVGVGSYFGIDALLEHQKALDAHDQYLDKVSKEKEVDDQEYADMESQLEKANKEIEDIKFGADLFFAIGAAFALSSVILFFLTNWNSHEEPPSVSRIEPNLFITTRLSERGVYGNLKGYFDTPSF